MAPPPEQEPPPTPHQDGEARGRRPGAAAVRSCALDAAFYGLTMALFAATLVTDLFVVIEHWLYTYKSWAYFTVGLAFVPSCFVQMLSLKWYQSNGDLRGHQWISHIFHFAIMHRFCVLLNSAIKTMKIQVSPQQRDWIFRVENDAFTLNLFTSLLVSVPQIILQIYTMAMLQHISFWTSASVIASLCSLTWALTAYALLINRANQDRSQFTWSSMMIQGFWRGGMLASRIAALVLAAICFKAWILVIFGIHALGMTVWIIQQTTNFCLTAVEELAYKCLIGAVYFFDFLRLTDNQVRYHVCVFYSVMIIQNAVFYAVYLVSFKNLFQTNVLIVSTVMILGGSFVGAISMLIHFCMFQNVKTIKLCKRIHVDPEVSFKVSPSKSIGKSPSKKWNNEPTTHESTESITPDITADKKSLLTNIVQSADSVEKGIVNTSFLKSDEANVTVQVVVEDSKVTNVDVSIEKLLGHAPVEKKFEDSCSVDISLETADQIKTSSTDSLHRQKRRGICSEVELDLKPNDCNLDLDPQLSQKRRGICSLTQLGLELVTDEDNYVEKSFSSLDKLKSNSQVSLKLDPDKSIDSGILDSLPIKNLITGDSCDVMIPENILIRGRLNTPVISDSGETTITNQVSEKEEASTSPQQAPQPGQGQQTPHRQEQHDQQEETMSHVTSIHDYENLCPLGVARPPWCIRSWRGYTDIETYIHDDSVVRDRRRDTLTSTATGTTLSSDFSDATYASLPLRRLMRRSRQDDYLDTLIYDLVDWESISNRAPVEELSMEVTTMTNSEPGDETQEQSSLFSAKPIVLDEKGGMLSLDTIVEEPHECHTSNSKSSGSSTSLSSSSGSRSFPELRASFSTPSSGSASCSVSSLVATIDEIRRCTAENSPRHVYHRTESHWEDLEQRILAKRAQLTRVLFRTSNDYSNVGVGRGLAEPWPAAGNCAAFVAERVNSRDDKLSLIREVTNYRLKEAQVGKTPLINAILSDSPILGPKTTGGSQTEVPEMIEEDNVYVDMNALGAQRCSTESHKEASAPLPDVPTAPSQQPTSTQVKIHDTPDLDEKSPPDIPSRKKVAFLLSNEIINEALDNTTSPEKSFSKSTGTAIANDFSIDKRLRTINRPRRKFSLLRERFEPKVCVVSPASHSKIISSRPQLSSLNKRISVIFNDPDAFDSSLNYDKENVNLNVNVNVNVNVEGKDAEVGKEKQSTESLREKRSVFLKQVLSPPRFQGWGKKRTFSPNAKIIPKAH